MAASVQSPNLSYVDLNRDGQPDVASIRLPFAGSGADLVHVYDRNNNMTESLDWRTAVDFEEDLWVFDAGGDGNANLIISFLRNGVELTAELYDDQDEDGQVRYTVLNGKVVIQESSHPTVRVRAPDGWWMKDGLVNYNLDIEVDGPVRATFYSPVLLHVQLWPQLTKSLLDGKPEYTIRVRDTDHDGRPDYDIRQVYPPPPLPDYYGTELTVNTNHNETTFGDFIFWPHLGTPADYIKPYAGSVAPIQVDWQASRIVAVAEFVASRGHDSNWFIYSRSKFGYDDRTFADFENPFA
ncbi:MAG: hypothetical protein FJ026_09800, partial [Chloroflexi bacterium]|nr:hypothetical protein [Chloroflexota bacterium]